MTSRFCVCVYTAKQKDLKKKNAYNNVNSLL